MLESNDREWWDVRDKNSMAKQQDNSKINVTEEEEMDMVEIEANVATLDQASVDEATVPKVEAKQVQWVNLPTAQDLRQHIFNVPDIAEELVEVSEWKAKILVRGMTGKQRARVLQGALNVDGTPNLEKMYPDMCIACCYHPDTRELIFHVADREELNKKAGGILERLAMTAARLSGLDKDQADALRKN